MSESSEDSEELLIDEQEKNILEKKGYQLEPKPFNSGSFASVFKAILRENGTKLAVKVIDCEKVKGDYKNRFLPREMYVLKKLKHRFIIDKREIVTINNKVFVIMEFAEGGDLNHLIKAMKKIDEPKAKILFRQLSEALNYMHNEVIAHRDIKCENVLLNKSKTVAKLTDFGFSRTCYDNATGRRLLTQTQCGSLAFVGPELIEGNKIPFDAICHDCWSIGVVLYCMVVGKLPFSLKLKAKQLLQKQLNRNYDLFDLELTDGCKDIVYKLLEPNVKTRLDMKQVLNQKWIKDIKV